MPKRNGQLETVSFIRSALVGRGYNIASRSVRVRGKEHWLVFEHRERSVGVDAGSGVWLREAPEGEWRCMEESCTIGGMLEAVEFLIKD